MRPLAALAALGLGLLLGSAHAESSACQPVPFEPGLGWQYEPIAGSAEHLGVWLDSAGHLLGFAWSEDTPILSAITCL